MRDNDTMLQINIEKRLPNFALNVDFEIGAEILVLFGASGAGKSLTLNCLAGLVTPDRGTIRLGERVVFDHDAQTNVPTRERRVGYVFQHYALFPHLTVHENVAFGVRGKSDGRVDEMLTLTHLAEFADRYPSQLSGGQQQRVALARALAPRPDVLLLDEPFSALDAPTRMELRRELLELQRAVKIPTVFVTHDLGEAYLLADRLAIIDQGKILQLDTPGEILRRPCCLQAARVIGVKNILPGVIAAREESSCRVHVGDTVIDAPPHAFEVGARVFVCLRAERVMLLRPERAGRSNGENALRGTIVRETNDGMNATLFFRSADERLMREQDYDLQIDLPVYIYERLDLAHQREWTVSLRKNAIHLIAA
jgi:molybdate transport system ATP-binding protein